MMTEDSRDFELDRRGVEIERLTAEVERLRAVLIDIGNLADISASDEYVCELAFRDIIFRCANAVAPEIGVD